MLHNIADVGGGIASFLAPLASKAHLSPSSCRPHPSCQAATNLRHGRFVVEGFLYIAGAIAFFGIMVGVPLSILRSLDEIKGSQRRLEARLGELESRLAEQDRVG